MSDTIENGKVITFSYTLKDIEGQMIEKSREGEDMEYLAGRQNMIPGLERAMLGMKVGEMKNIRVNAVDAYGPYDDKLVLRVPITNFPADTIIEPGMEFQTETDDGIMIIRVMELADEDVIVDGNHPMAGLDLVFDVIIESIREATPQELEHGHVHHRGHNH